jgi:endonuclease YncB( thermonuclease family)
MGHPGYEGAKLELARLILGKTVELRTAHRLDRGRLVADVYLGGTNLASSFREYPRS